jgi:hypothetical protein
MPRSIERQCHTVKIELEKSSHMILKGALSKHGIRNSVRLRRFSEKVQRVCLQSVRDRTHSHQASQASPNGFFGCAGSTTLLISLKCRNRVFQKKCIFAQPVLSMLGACADKQHLYKLTCKKTTCQKTGGRTLEFQEKSVNKFHCCDQNANCCREHDAHSNREFHL